MIFVTVGTHDQQFDRLVKAADELAAIVSDEVIIQRGASNYLPKYAEHFDFITAIQVKDWVSRSRAVIAQAGAGTILTVLDYKKPLIVVPRLSAFGENYNDHQLEIANALADQKRVICVLEPTAASLLAALDAVSELVVAQSDQSMNLITALKNQLSIWEHELIKKRVHF